MQSNLASKRSGSASKISVGNVVLAISQPCESKSVAIVKKAPLRASSKSIPSKLPKPAEKSLASRTTSSYQDGPSIDIDKRDSDDPVWATTYVQDMYQYYREQEHRAVVGPYMDNQQFINERMRAVLVDWLCSISHKMKCDPETLYLTVNIIDHYLSKRTASTKNLQLIGSSALFIASKYEQIYPVDVNDLVYVCNKLYTEDDVRQYPFLINFSFLARRHCIH